jgi:hypothetical protein
MATTTDNKRPVTGAESEFDHASRTTPRPEIRVNQTNQGSGSTIAYIIAALVIAVAGYYLYTSYYSPTSVTPSVTQTTPPPAVTAPAADAPAVTPPAATAPATDAPAATPATPPATTTTP